MSDEYTIEQYTADQAGASSPEDRKKIYDKGIAAGLPLGPIGADAFVGGPIGPPGTEQAQPPMSPEPSSTDHPSTDLSDAELAAQESALDEPDEKHAHATRSDNVGKNWGGTPSRPEDQGAGPDAPKITDVIPPPSLADAARKAMEEHAVAMGQGVDGDAADRDWVYLPQAVSSEFAIQLDSARDMVLTGEVTVDGKEVDVVRGYVKRVDIFDQWIQIVSDVKSVRFKYAPNG